MNIILTSLAFGFGGWIGVFGSMILFLNVPHTHTLIILLLSPWIGGVSLYLLMFATHAWINVFVQIVESMTLYEIIMAVLFSCIGVLIVSIARVIIEMERGQRTPAQVAAEESVNETVPIDGVNDTTNQSERNTSESEIVPEEASASDSESESEEGSNTDSEIDADDESGNITEETSKSNDDESGNITEETSKSNDDDDDESDNITEETSKSNDADDELDNITEETSKSNDEAAEVPAALNEAIVDDSYSSSYENINTPQLTAQVIRTTSPIPIIPDI